MAENKASKGVTDSRVAKIDVTKITLDENNRMLRAGFGKHDGKWFIRVDLWWAGWRLARETA